MTCLTQLPPSLWQDCDLLYAQQQAEYLKLQDEHGVNVNLALLATWLDSHDYLMPTQSWQHLTTQIASFELNLLQPYRRLRKLSKGHLAPDEYQQMLTVELMLERKVQKLILHTPSLLQSSPHADNLARYLSLFDMDIGEHLARISNR